MPDTLEALLEQLTELLGTIEVNTLYEDGLVHNGLSSARENCAMLFAQADSWTPPGQLSNRCTDCTWDAVKVQNQDDLVISDQFLSARTALLEWLDDPDPDLDSTTEAVRGFSERNGPALDRVERYEQMEAHLRRAMLGQLGRDIRDEVVNLAMVRLESEQKMLNLLGMTNTLEMFEDLQVRVRKDVEQQSYHLVIINHFSGGAFYQTLLDAYRIGPDLYTIPNELRIFIGFSSNVVGKSALRDSYQLTGTDIEHVTEVMELYDFNGTFDTLEKAFEAVKAL